MRINLPLPSWASCWSEPKWRKNCSSRSSSLGLRRRFRRRRDPSKMLPTPLTSSLKPFYDRDSMCSSFNGSQSNENQLFFFQIVNSLINQFVFDWTKRPSPFNQISTQISTKFQNGSVDNDQVGRWVHFQWSQRVTAPGKSAVNSPPEMTITKTTKTNKQKKQTHTTKPKPKPKKKKVPPKWHH